MSKIAVAMSGGVDSSVVFRMLYEEGHEVFGITMRHLPEELVRDRIGSCCAPRAVRAASRLAASLNRPHYLFDLSEEFAATVMRWTAEAYRSGVTPNPCVLCNEGIKFGLLFQRARALGAEFLATGHYARVHNGRLFAARDRMRDQSYFLYRVPRSVLSATFFPLGEVGKDEVRRMAEEWDLEMKDAPDSTDVCFAPEGDFSYIFERFAPEAIESGPIVDEATRLLGRHRGFGRVTIGQRRGLGIPASERLYVRAIRPETKTVVLGGRPVASRMLVENLIWHQKMPERFEAVVKIRSRHPGRAVSIERIGDRCHVTFPAPEPNVTPGQSAVFYEGDCVLGGGIICQGEV
ncbi:MAG: tRNA 2-thiouridine(34) synthase MnmA [Candidatus Hydrogenedentota bacterium]|nr:MAG: tRNA 2-thiouridine(34) synthase MnmA [Candidatus Hydrogenedentota bacterium]